MPEYSEHLADAIEDRRRQLRYTPTALIAATGLSAPALQNIRKGEIRQYQDRLVGPLTRALGWTPDSIQRLIDGERPVDLRDALSSARGHVASLELELRKAFGSDDPDDEYIEELSEELTSVRRNVESLEELWAEHRAVAEGATTSPSVLEVAASEAALVTRVEFEQRVESLQHELDAVHGVLQRLSGLVEQIVGQSGASGGSAAGPSGA